MSNSFFISFNRFIFLIIIVTVFICFFFIPILYINKDLFSNISYDDLFYFSDSEYIWPTPGYTSINSYFGKRISPTSGASSYHSGIDIGAPEGSELIAITSGKITFANFLGGGGYTITLANGNMKVTYCHTSPTYIVKVGDIVEKGQVIGFVGPKNVYGVKGNTYKDSYRKAYKWYYNGPSSSFRCSNKWRLC